VRRARQRAVTGTGCDAFTNDPTCKTAIVFYVPDGAVAAFGFISSRCLDVLLDCPIRFGFAKHYLLRYKTLHRLFGKF
jgi:hypothetical protein